ncbi:MAG: glutamine-hydrolyzing carbamoyl-phosphate synthase small subunit, partial [Myxococcota bacterium]
MTGTDPAVLVLADGTVYRGGGFGSRTEGCGEVVFHTGMTGYQEILTDPSYAGQIVCMTYPEIGNVGTNPEDEESRGLFLEGFVVREHVDFPSSWRSRESLQAYLVRHGVPGISGIDTRALVRRIRKGGAQNGILASGEVDLEALRRRAAALPDMAGRNLVDRVSTREVYTGVPGARFEAAPASVPEPRYRVVALDFGIKRNILRQMSDCGLDVTVVPAATSAEDVIAMDPDGIFLSNGPGDPRAVPYAAPTVRALLGQRPIFGICLGHQILGLALGGQIRKMRFGHHGANQPARDEASGRVWIASENHGFALEPDALARDPEIEITYCNLNDGTVEGISHPRLRAFSVQYHPEASPGPGDAAPLFWRFRESIEVSRAPAP